MQLSKCLAAGVVTLVLALAPAAASARTYNVYGLGQNGAACEGWSSFNPAPASWTQAQSCAGSWYTEARSGRSIPYLQGAGFQAYAPAGTVFAGFAVDSEITMNTSAGGPGMTWRQALCSASTCADGRVVDRSAPRRRYTLGALRSPAAAVRATRALVYLYCSNGSGCKPLPKGGRPAFATSRNSHLVVDDYTPPRAAALSGLSTGWNSGLRTLRYSARDTGGGVERVALTIDRSASSLRSHSCRRVKGGGYSRPQPCATSVVSHFQVNSAASRLPDGQHSLTFGTLDAAGNGSYARRSFKIDNTAPASVIKRAVAGGSGWHRRNGFTVSWINPAAGKGAPVSALRYRIGSAPTSARDGTRIPGNDISRLRVNSPGDGSRPLYIWLEDEAGNTNHRTARAVQLRLDTRPPTGAFQAVEDPADPREIRASVRDRTSRLASAAMQYRPAGGGTWRSLPARLSGEELVASFPEDRLPRGSYELRVLARDRAGNRATIARRADGRPMRLISPLRPAPVLNAGLVGPRASRRRGSGRGRKRARVRSTLVVPYGKGATLRGTFRAATGAPLSDAGLAILAKIPGQSAYRQIGRVTTGRSGGYAYRLGPGPSRRLVVVFGGSPALRSSSAAARLRVQGASTLRLTPRRLRVGRVLRFTGHVRSHIASAYGEEGKLVQVQFRDGSRWRPAVALTRTDEEGYFSIRYRFRRITRPTRIRFRVLVPSEGGWPYATGKSRSRVVDVYPRR